VATGPRVPRVQLRERSDPEPKWRRLWRVRIPGEHRRVAVAWPRSRSSQNGLPGGARLRSGRAGGLPASPVFVGRGRYVRRTQVRRGDRTSEREKPSSRFMSPGSAFGRVRRAKSWRENGESDREAPAGAAPAAVEREPARKKRPARAGTAPREGKALEGSSRDASGMKEGREASGATANGGVQKTSSEPRASRNRREGQEP